jgi:uncharacterized protein (TIGR01244 family)
MRALIVALALASVVAAPQVEKQSVAGITNFTRVDSTVACAGATTPAAVAEVKKLGYRSIINLRRATETGAEVEAEGVAAKEAGVTYISLPLSPDEPDPAVADQFLEVITDPANQPALIHCATGGRAAAMWMIKRMIVDGWDADRASAEAADIGLKSETLKAFALDYASKHKRSQVAGPKSLSVRLETCDLRPATRAPYVVAATVSAVGP